MLRETRAGITTIFFNQLSRRLICQIGSFEQSLVANSQAELQNKVAIYIGAPGFITSIANQSGLNVELLVWAHDSLESIGSEHRSHRVASTQVP